MTEIWRDIPGYEGHYQASSLGRIRSIKKHPVVLKGDVQANGYNRVYLWMAGGKKNCLVHRLVASTFIPNPNGYSEINHLDEDKSNNCINNLEWCNHFYNMHYGTTQRKIAESRRGTKLSPEHIQRLREDTANRRWINDGKRNRYVKKNEINEFLESGWNPGRIMYWRT